MAGLETGEILAKKIHPSGVTKLEGSKKIEAATELIEYGIDFNSVTAGRGSTILRLRDVPKRDKSYMLPKGDWVGTARLDNQGDTKDGYVRLAVQIENKTHAQANVKIGVNFGKDRIQKAMKESLKNGKLEQLTS